MGQHHEMSHAEIWDDSSLVDSWNEALEEYNQYHSIHARGEQVEEVLKEADQVGVSSSAVLEIKQDTHIGSRGGEGDYEDDQPLINDPHAKRTTQEESADLVMSSLGNETRGEDHRSASTAIKGQALGSTSKGPALPQSLIGQVHDEELKSLLMSWYYAGYYTGLYEGRASKNAKHEA